MKTKTVAPEVRALTRLVAAVAILASACVATLVPVAQVATAAGSPDLVLAVTAPDTALIVAPATSITETAKVTNPNGPNGYNLGFRVVLPAGLSFGGTSNSVPRSRSPSGPPPCCGGRTCPTS